MKGIFNQQSPFADDDDDGSLAVAEAQPKLQRPPLYRVILW